MIKMIAPARDTDTKLIPILEGKSDQSDTKYTAMLSMPIIANTMDAKVGKPFVFAFSFSRWERLL